MSSGHLFIINGDLTKLACDAILIPTDAMFSIEASWRPLVQDGEIPESWNSQLVLPLSRQPKRPWVWLANVGLAGDESDFTPFEPAVQQFAAKAAAALRDVRDTDRIYPWPKRRLAVNLIGSGRGGGSKTKGELLEGLVGTLESLVRTHHVDIVLVAFGEKPFAAAQRARHRVIDRDWLDKTWAPEEVANRQLFDEAKRLAKTAIQSQLVLFLGAGVSAGAGLPMWSPLLENIAAEAGLTPALLQLLREKDPRDQATFIKRRLCSMPEDFKCRGAKHLSGPDRYSLQHGLLASLPSREAVTTNFDELFESAVEVANRKLAVLPDDPQMSDGRWLLKLHGTVSEPTQIVLTRSDYLNMPKQYGALMGLVQGMLLMRHMMFVGYSLMDEDFHEIVHEVRAARGARPGEVHGTVLTLFNDPLERELWANDLHVVPMIDGPPETVPREVAARQLEIFLDLLGFLSTTSAPFFLDLSYRSLSDDEATLRDSLLRVAALTHSATEGTVGFRVKHFLEEPGADALTAKPLIAAPAEEKTALTEDNQLEALQAACDRDLGDPGLWHKPDGYRDSLALCIIDAIYSTGAHYSSVVNVVDRYREHRASQGANAHADGVLELLAHIDAFGGADGWASHIGNRRPTSTAQGAPLKSDAIRQVAEGLLKIGIHRTADLRTADADALRDTKRVWTSVPGQRSGITWEYALMLAGVPGVKADRMVVRYVARAISKPIAELSPAEAAYLVGRLATSNGWDVIQTDHAIWRFESGRPGMTAEIQTVQSEKRRFR